MQNEKSKREFKSFPNEPFMGTLAEPSVEVFNHPWLGTTTSVAKFNLM